MAFYEEIPYSKIGVGIAIFLGGGVTTYAVLRYTGSAEQRKDEEAIATLSTKIDELKIEIEELKKLIPCELGNINSEIQLLQTAFNDRRTKSQSNFSVYSYKTAWSDDDNENIDSRKQDVPSPIEGGDSLLQNNNAVSNEEKKRSLYAKIDSLYTGSDEDKETAMRVLQDNEINYKDDWEFLWRLGRSHVSVHEMRYLVEEKRVHALAGHEYTERALDIYEASSDVHKWYAIALGTMMDYVSTKDKILNGYKLKQHISRALELSPAEATLHFMLGRWCWGIYMLTWIERKLASTLFATPPTSSVQEALECFLKAEELDHGFYKSNQLYIGKCYYEMSKYKEAKNWLEKAKELKIVNIEDQKAHDEVVQLLTKL
uniref:regulator of microtubule dynamics protein 2-like n=1 Tax=Styela clava TaxID=7725 RepID=UPI0019399F14|nr:regulator of microtubule dynamics protein 2-like [Styela clava]